MYTTTKAFLDLQSGNKIERKGEEGARFIFILKRIDKVTEPMLESPEYNFPFLEAA